MARVRCPSRHVPSLTKEDVYEHHDRSDNNDNEEEEEAAAEKTWTT